MIENVEKKPIVTREEITPKTLEEFQDLEKLILAEIEQMEKALKENGVKRGVYFIRDPKKDSLQAARDRGALVRDVSDFISLSHPTVLNEGNCVLLKIQELMANFVNFEPIEPLSEEASRAFYTLRLADAAINSITKIDSTEFNPVPLTGKDLNDLFYLLTGHCSPPYSYSYEKPWVNDNIEIYLIIKAASAAAKKPETKAILNHLIESGFYLEEVDKTDWPFLTELLNKRYLLVINVRLNRRHTDLITKIDLKRGLVNLKNFGTLTFTNLENAMKPEHIPMEIIPPFEIGLPDEEEFKILKQLLE